jgi:ABC-type sugar transport system permease subunit
MTRRFDDIVAPAIAALLVFSVLGGASVAVVRYVEATDQLGAQRPEAIAALERLAQRLPSEGVEILRGHEGFVASAVAHPAKKGKWGRTLKPRVALREVRDDRLREDCVEPDCQGVFSDGVLSECSGRMTADLAKTGEVRATAYLVPHFEDVLFLVDVPIVAGNDELWGVLRVVVPFRPYEGSVGVLELGVFGVLVFLLTCLLAWRSRRGLRWWVTLLLGLLMAALLRDKNPEALVWGVGIVMAGSLLSVEGLRAVLVGIRKQPKTYLFIAPAIAAMVLVVFLPFAIGVAIAFVDKSGGLAGFQNFREILIPEAGQTPSFYWTLGITVVWTVANVLLHLLIGIGLALVLNRPDLRFKGLYRVLLIVPWAVPSYITALLWKYMFQYEQGAINAIIGLFGGDKVNWLGDSALTNFLANLVTNTWLGFPFMMVVTLGALQSIPRDLYEAADIDGASRWQSFRHITLPLLKPALVPAIILGTIWTFNMFNVIYLVSGGGPDGKTNILITEAYDSFMTSVRLGESPGYAAAYCVLILGILLVYGWMTNRITKATEGVYS